jgi:hypothetical protein
MTMKRSSAHVLKAKEKALAWAHAFHARSGELALSFLHSRRRRRRQCDESHRVPVEHYYRVMYVPSLYSSFLTTHESTYFSLQAIRHNFEHLPEILSFSLKPDTEAELGKTEKEEPGTPQRRPGTCREVRNGMSARRRPGADNGEETARTFGFFASPKVRPSGNWYDPEIHPGDTLSKIRFETGGFRADVYRSEPCPPTPSRSRDREDGVG